jgi:hypothetical protein
MAPTTRQLLRLIAVIEQRFDLTEREKEEYLSILDDPAEAAEALEAGLYDPLFPRLTVVVAPPDGQEQWQLQIGPHAQIEAILDNIRVDDLVDLFHRFLDKARAGGIEIIEDKYLISGTNPRHQLISMVVYIRGACAARVATTYKGRPRKTETGARARI